MLNLPGYVIPERDRDVLYASLAYEASEHLTICEQLRFIYDIVHHIPDDELRTDLTDKLITALEMGKKMNSRLQRYKRETGDQTGSAGSNLLKLEHTKAREAVRRRRK